MVADPSQSTCGDLGGGGEGCGGDGGGSGGGESGRHESSPVLGRTPPSWRQASVAQVPVPTLTRTSRPTEGREVYAREGILRDEEVEAHFVQLGKRGGKGGCVGERVELRVAGHDDASAYESELGQVQGVQLPVALHRELKENRAQQGHAHRGELCIGIDSNAVVNLFQQGQVEQWTSKGRGNSEISKDELARPCRSVRNGIEYGL